jgi:PKD repeat protein
MKLESHFRLFGLLRRFSWVVVYAAAIVPAFAALDNQGKEFVLGFMENYEGGGNVSLYLTGPKATTVTVQGAGFGPAAFSVDPGAVTPVSLPVTVRATGSGRIEDKGLFLSAPDEFVVYGLNQQVYTTDAYLGLPIDSTGTEYIVPSMPNSKKSLSSELQIIAHEDDTEVTITPKKRTIEGPDVKSIKAGKSAHFTLNRLQSIQFKAKGGTAADLTGSVITSSKPISVFSGHQCGIVPSRALACDHLVEQIPPIDTWGTSFLTTPLATRTGGDIFRILAAKNGTKVEIDGKTVAKLKRGQFKQVDLASGSFHQITTSGPTLVVQYSKGTSVDGVVSDPFMMIIPPTEQFGSDYLISTPPEEPVRFENYINIVAPTDKLAGLRLDGGAIAGPFTAIGTTGFSGAQVKVDIGVHQITHDPQNVPFGVYSYGFAASDSYGYPGGARLAKIADQCSPTDTVQADGIDNDCDRKIDEELLNGTDDDGDGKVDEDLAKIRPPVADAGGAYTVDEGSSVSLNAANSGHDPYGDEVTFEWDLDNDGSFETSGVTPSFQGIDGPSVQTVVLRVTGQGGVNQVSTIVTVNNAVPVVDAGADATLPENGLFSQAGSFTDPGADNWTATVDYGDGTGVQPLVLSGKTFTLEHPYGDNGSYTVTVTVTDDDGATGSDTVQVTVNNAVPVVDAGADAALPENGLFNQAGTFTDPGADSWTATVDYGDGTGGQPLLLSGKSFTLEHTYGDNGSYTVTVTVTDNDGATGSDTVQVTVNNAVPVVNAGADATLPENGLFNQAGTFTDPGTDSWTATVDYGDGTDSQPLLLNGKSFTLEHTYGDNDSYTVTVTVTDDDGATGSDTVQVTVNNVVPVVSAGADTTVDEGAVFSQLGSFVDPGTGPWSAAVNYGDGTGVQPLTLTGKNFSLNHVYGDNGSYTVTVTVTDDDGASGSGTVQVGVSNTAPVVDAGADATLPENGLFSQAGTFTDPGADNWTATVDYGDGTGVQPLVLSGKSFMLEHPYGDNGSYTVTVTVTDDDGATGSDTVQVGVSNAVPVVDAGADATLPENGLFNQAGTFTDPGADSWTATVDYGDGTGVQPLVLSGKSFMLEHPYGDNGSYTVTVTVTDNDGATGSDTVQVTANNAVPVVDAGADATLPENGLFSQAGSFTDPGTDSWTASVDYGDGAGVQPLVLNGKSFTLEHTYGDNGSYTVTVTVTDDDGATGSDTVQVTVNNVVPVVSAGVDTTVDEGAVFSQPGSFVDPGTGPWSATVNYGDGTGVQPLTLTGKNFSLNHIYGDNGSYTVTVTVTDDDGASGSDSVQVGVSNTAPTITSASWNDSCDQEVLVTYSDPANALDKPYVLTINWSIDTCSNSTEECSTTDYQQTVNDYSSGDPIALDYNPGNSASIYYTPTSLTVSDKDGGSDTTATLPDHCEFR